MAEQAATRLEIEPRPSKLDEFHPRTNTFRQFRALVSIVAIVASIACLATLYIELTHRLLATLVSQDKPSILVSLMCQALVMLVLFPACFFLL